MQFVKKYRLYLLWPFTKRQMHDYINKFATMRSKNNIKNKNNDWTAQQYNVLSSLVKQYKYNLEKLRIQMNVNKIKSALKQYCLNLGLDMFIQGDPIAVESDFPNENKNEIISNKLDPNMKSENKNDINSVWEKYFNDDSIAKYILKRVKYYVAQKILFDIILWKPNIVGNINNQQFQQQFEIHDQKFLINRKLLNEKVGIIQFI
ncbi:hypothetical protein RFI_26479, partial [Reticulomyxa filosa]